MWGPCLALGGQHAAPEHCCVSGTVPTGSHPQSSCLRPLGHGQRRLRCRTDSWQDLGLRGVKWFFALPSLSPRLPPPPGIFLAASPWPHSSGRAEGVFFSAVNTPAWAAPCC